MTDAFHHQIETRLPLPAGQGRVELSGWCAPRKTNAPTQVKLVWAQGEIAARSLPRPDVGVALGISAKDEPWGFVISGELPPGAHHLVLRAKAVGEGSWQDLEHFTAVIFSRGLQAQVEYPRDEPITESLRIQGWCYHPEKPLQSVWLHYGTRRLPCEFGLPRTDLALAAPNGPNATRSGFIATENVRAGRSLLRIAAIDSEGVRHVVRTDRHVDINSDVKTPQGLNLPARLARVSSARLRGHQAETPPRSSLRPKSTLRILFVLYGDFTSNSAIHVVALANAMAQAGAECVVVVPENPETVSLHGRVQFSALPFSAVPDHGRVYANGQPPDIIHAWTSRENVRVICERLCQNTDARLVVHLEDNERQILETHAGLSTENLLRLPEDELDRVVGPFLSHPRRAGLFLRSADGATVLMDKLRELVPPGPPIHRFWPAADARRFFPREIPVDLREALGFGANHTVLFYHGNVHAANRAEVGELYAAVTKLNEQGLPTTLLRCGRDTVAFDADRRQVISLGQIRNAHIGPLLALADFLVQPGEADAFNDYRFPSKLPEFFSAGRPVILPATNLGREVRHLEDAYVLKKADAAGIAGAIRVLRDDAALRKRLSEGAVAFGEKHFSWERAAAGLLQFYLERRARA